MQDRQQISQSTARLALSAYENAVGGGAVDEEKLEQLVKYLDEFPNVGFGAPTLIWIADTASLIRELARPPNPPTNPPDTQRLKSLVDRIRAHT